MPSAACAAPEPRRASVRNWASACGSFACVTIACHSSSCAALGAGPAPRRPVIVTTAATVTAAAASSAAGGSFARSTRRAAAAKPVSAGRIVRIGCIACLIA